MNRGHFQAIATSKEESEFTFWVENQIHRPEVLNPLVERYADDIYRLGFIWFYEHLQDEPDQFQVFLFAFVLDVFKQALQDISDFNGRDSVGLWLYEIAIQTAKRHNRKVKVQQLFGSLQGQKLFQDAPKITYNPLSLSKKLGNLAPHQRLILILRHAYQMELSQLAALFRQDISFVQYELATARQKLFESEDRQEDCFQSDFKYLLQAHYDGLLYSNEYMPLELEEHLSECESCSKLNGDLIQLGQLIENELADDPYISFEDSSDRQLIVESINEENTGVGANAKKAITFVRQAFVVIVILLAIVVFVGRSLVLDRRRAVPVFPLAPIFTPTAYVQPSDLFQEISVDEAQFSLLSSIYNGTPATIWMRTQDGGGYCISTTEDGASWLPPERCQEVAIETYNDWIASNNAFNWIYSDFSGPVKHVYSLAFSPDGNTLAGLTIDSRLHIWRVEDGYLLDSIKLNGSATSQLAYSPDGTQISVGLQNGTLTTIADLESKNTNTLLNFNGPVTSLDYASDGRFLIVGEKGTAWRFELSDGKKDVLDNFPFPDNQVTSLDISPDGNFLAFGLDDGTIWLYRFEDNHILARLNGHSAKITHIAFTPGGQYLASGAIDGNVIMWDISDTSTVTKLYEINHRDWIVGLEFSPDGTLLATAALGDGQTISGVYLWSVSEGNLINMVANDGLFTARSIAFSPNGKTLAIGSITGSVKLWNIPR